MSPSAPGSRRKPDPPRPASLAGQPVSFVGSFPDPAVRLDPVLPEVAFLGRSNVGKSSLLNALVGRKTLARVSGTPGKTQLMNVFQVAGLYLVDLPGYGWAKASHVERARFRQLVEDYLERRSTVRGVVWLLDIRHEPSTEDRVIQDLLVRTGWPALTVLTKADKLSRAERLRAVRTRAEDLGVAPAELLVTSARTGEGIGELGESVLAVASRLPD